MRKCKYYTLLLSLLFIASSSYGSSANEDPRPSIDKGAVVYKDRCVLCHGSHAMGDGVLPLKLKNYPDTNLRKANKASTRSEILSVNVHGGTQTKISQHMPPFGKELSWTELESVTDFVMLLRSNPDKAFEVMESNQGEHRASAREGEHIFATRCVLCHGKYGEGDGRMSKLLKTPPPADLTASRLPDEYLKKIINDGGEAVGRSKHMPPWRDQLNDSEVSDVIEYIKSIRD